MASKRKPTIEPKPTPMVQVQWRQFWSVASLVPSAVITFSAMVGAFGAVAAFAQRLSPWPTMHEINASIDAKFDKAPTLEKIAQIIDDRVNPIADWLNDEQCKDYNDRFVRAQRAYQRNPGDMVAQDSMRAANDKLKIIPKCKPEVLIPPPVPLQAEPLP